ncbi:MAG: HlyD family efflux transporter periplasmic adaptor subunit [Paramuribaculum sp.]|nr:HlyD family efflux transporter periplasmic adaptor subunit [Paramuribaculum sp.]
MKPYLYPALAEILITACSGSTYYDSTVIFEATTITISAETSGKILSIGISEGDSVTAGEVIATVDTTLLTLQARQLESQRQSAESVSPDIAAQATALRSQIEYQKHECDRVSRLLADGAATQKQYDDSRAMLTTLEGQLTALLSTLSKNRSSITDNALAIQYQAEQVEQQIARSIVRTPITATVLEKYAEPGEFTTPGRPLCKLADLNNIYLRAYFTVSQLADLSIGQQVTVTADFGGDEQYDYPGVITWIAQESEFTPKSIQTNDTRANLVYAVKIAVKNDGRLKLGQYGEVKL